MKLQKKAILSGLSFLVGVGLYNLCVFLIVGNYTDRFWTAYAFTMLAFLSQIIIPFILSRDTDIRKDCFLRLPLWIHSNIYFTVQLVSGILFMIIPLPVKVAIIVESIILAIYLTVAISAMMGKDVIAETEINIKANTAFIRNLTLQSEMLYNKETNVEKKNELKRLYEVVRYSDPISSTQKICSLNGEIELAFNMLCKNIAVDTFSDFKKDIDVLINLINQRNAICKASK